MYRDTPCEFGPNDTKSEYFSLVCILKWNKIQAKQITIQSLFKDPKAKTFDPFDDFLIFAFGARSVKTYIYIYHSYFADTIIRENVVLQSYEIQTMYYLSKKS